MLWLWVFLCIGAATAQVFNEPSGYFGGETNTPYLQWLAEAGGSYANSLFLFSQTDPNDGVAVHWKIVGDSIAVAVAARAEGWVAIGFSENGGMFGSDVVHFEAVDGSLTDAHILRERAVEVDTCQDWNLVANRTDDGFLIFEATRLLDTGDPQDRALMDDALPAIPSTRIIAAWGDQERVGYHGPRRARGAVRWFADYESGDESTDFLLAMAEADGSFFVGADNFAIPNVETTYQYFCVYWDELVAQGVPNKGNMSIIGIEPVLDPATIQYVHHFVVHTSLNAKTPEDGCSVLDAVEIAYAWAPGEPPFALPENLGEPLGNGTGFMTFVIQIHYNNPLLDEGAFDSSGVRFYYTEQAREIEMGYLQLGDPYVELAREPLGVGLVEHSFVCKPSCSSFFLRSPVTILRDYMHMHQAGSRIYTELIRDDEVVHSSAIDYFDFEQQGNQPVQQKPFEVLPGDSFRTVCQYESTEGTVFGRGSEDEMCMNFLMYYPRQKALNFPWICAYKIGFLPCESEHSERVLEAPEVTFGQPVDTCAPRNTIPAGTVSAATISVVPWTSAVLLVSVMFL